MGSEDYRVIRNFFFYAGLGIMCAAGTACTVQWAFRNKNTDCGFTNDRISPLGHKDPAIFYGNHGEKGK